MGLPRQRGQAQGNRERAEANPGRDPRLSTFADGAAAFARTNAGGKARAVAAAIYVACSSLGAVVTSRRISEATFWIRSSDWTSMSFEPWKRPM